MKIVDFLKSPKESIPLLNGWQRIWLILTGLLLAIHVVLFFYDMPSASSIFPNTNNYSETIKSSDKWLLENKLACDEAKLAIDQAQQKNEDFNSVRKGEANKQRQVYLDKIQLANERLYKIETTGGKYNQEWSNINDSIYANQKKLNSLVWTDRKFIRGDMVEPMILATVINCESMIAENITSKELIKEAKKNSKQLLDRFFNEIFWLIVSFFAWSGILYFLGWGFGWVRDGFKNK
jgi:hypothetical protein